VYSWRVIQYSLDDPAERHSTLRLGVLYFLALGGVITVITTAWNIVNTVLLRLLGQEMSLADFTGRIGAALSIGLPLGVVWAYHGYWLNRHIEGVGDRVRQAGMKRLYNYILALIGLAVTFTGVATLFNFLIDVITGSDVVIGDARRGGLASSIASLIVGLPLWLLMWRPLQAEALAQGELGDHARRSVVRKAYLYLVLFASVIGGMATAVGLVYLLLRTVLGAGAGSNFVNELLNLIQLLSLFSVLLLYHLNVLRTDGASTADSLAERQRTFNVLVVDSGNGFVESVRAALVKFAPNAPVTVTTAGEMPQGRFDALILNGSLAVNAPEWIRSFNGSRIIIRDDSNSLVWTEDAAQAAQSVQQLAEGQEIHRQKTSRSPWTFVVYLFAALFGLILMVILISLAVALVT
jgi:hypothetical protein